MNSMAQPPLIAKRITSNAKNAPPHRNLRATINYIDNASGHGDKLHHIDGMPVVGSFNILSPDEDRQAQCKEIACNHKRYKGKGKRLDHIILSYSSQIGPTLTAKDFRSDVKTLLKHMGFSEHACMYAVHSNTKNIHIHIAIDRVSVEPKANFEYYIPVDVGTVRDKSKDGRYRRNNVLCMHAAMYEICARRGYATDYLLADDTGQVLKKAQKMSVSHGSTQGEVRTGQKSLERQLLEQANEILSLATSWSDALTKLNTAGIIYNVAYNKRKQPKGGVLIAAENPKVQLLSSRLQNKNSFKGLVARFGDFDKSYLQRVEQSFSQHSKAEITIAAAKKLLHGIFQEAWDKKLDGDAFVQKLTMQGFKLNPSGGSYTILFNDNKDKLKLSEVGRHFTKQHINTILDTKAVQIEAPEIDVTKSAQTKAQLKSVIKKKTTKQPFERSAYYKNMFAMSGKIRKSRMNLTRKSLHCAEIDASKKSFAIKNQSFNLNEEITHG